MGRLTQLGCAAFIHHLSKAPTGFPAHRHEQEEVFGASHFVQSVTDTTRVPRLSPINGCLRGQVHVEAWRTALWRDALMAQGIDDAELAQKLQEEFRTRRLEHFQLEPGVKASPPPRLRCHNDLPESTDSYNMAALTPVQQRDLPTYVSQEMVADLRQKGLKQIIITNGCAAAARHASRRTHCAL